VVEIDAALIDPSPIPDRLPGDPSADAELIESIRETGQHVPILLRPDPTREGRFIIVYGHRRVAAARALKRPVKAIVAAMSDEESYVAQGIENSARNDLSFIERALFAARLDQAGVPRPQIASALHTCQSHVSTMITLAKRIPFPLIEAIGATPNVGRRRWEQLDALITANNRAVWKATVADPSFATAAPDERFSMVFAKMAAPSAANPPPAVVVTKDGAAIATFQRVRNGDVKIVLPRAAKIARGDGRTFVDWLEERITTLRETWEQGG
jgi:ParB family chromosome partitioning protein